MPIFTQEQYAARLSVFTDAGLIPVMPTRFQRLQGIFEMTPYVASTDATAERFYRKGILAHHLVRQTIILAYVGFDHLRVGTALGGKLDSVCKHLHITYHEGMPCFDLQIIQSHPDGLNTFERQTQELIEGKTPWARKRLRFQRLLFPEPATYLQQFLGDDGWIARARRLEYPTPEQEGSAFPPEFFSVVTFLNHCAQSYAPTRSELRVPLVSHFYRLYTRRFREAGMRAELAAKRAALTAGETGAATAAISEPRS